MNLTATHSNHINIVDSRRSAARFLTNHKGITVWNGSTRVTKARMLISIMKGFFDGYYYRHNSDAGTITFRPVGHYHGYDNVRNLTNRIGN